MIDKGIDRDNPLIFCANCAFFLNHLITSIFFSSIYQDIHYRATYPSHLIGGLINSKMGAYLKVSSIEYGEKYLGLFCRHTEAPDSGQTRNKGGKVKFENQISTVHLNPEFSDKIVNKNIIVIDDFITEGFSSECARNLLLKAGTSNIISLGIGKYGLGYLIITINGNFDPFAKIDSQKSTLSIDFENDIQTELEESFKQCY